MKFSINDFFSNYDQNRSADLVTFTEEIVNGKLHFSLSLQFFSVKNIFEALSLKVLPISLSSYENNMLNISH